MRRMVNWFWSPSLRPISLAKDSTDGPVLAWVLPENVLGFAGGAFGHCPRAFPKATDGSSATGSSGSKFCCSTMTLGALLQLYLANASSCSFVPIGGLAPRGGHLGGYCLKRQPLLRRLRFLVTAWWHTRACPAAF